MSTRQLERHFQCCLGIAPKLWLQQCRMHSALSMLMDGQPTKYVALELCYRGSCQFCREFKHFYGLTPQQAVEKHLVRMFAICRVLHTQ